MAESSSQYFYLWENDAQTGPFEIAALGVIMGASELSAETLYWQEGMADWAPLAEWSEFIRLEQEPEDWRLLIPSQQPETVMPLKCPNCGAGLKGASESGPAGELTCAFCGTICVTPSWESSLLENLEPEGNELAEFDGHQAEMVLAQQTVSSAVDLIRDEIKRTPGCFTPVSKLKISAHGIWLPVWMTRTQVHCTWAGEYSQQQEKTRRLHNGTIERYTETTWHPTSGVHDFAKFYSLPAGTGISQTQVRALAQEKHWHQAIKEPPEPDEEFSVVPATITDRAAWNQANGQANLEKLAWERCQQLAERLKHVEAVPTDRECSLVYLPFARVEYTANDLPFHHLFNLSDGTYLGELPPDLVVIRRQAKFYHWLKWIALPVAALLLLVSLGYLVVSLMDYFNSTGPSLPAKNSSVWQEALVALIAGTLSATAFYIGNAWKRFVEEHKVLFWRHVIGPDPELREYMRKRMGNEDFVLLDNFIRQNLDQNHLGSAFGKPLMATASWIAWKVFVSRP